MSKVCTLASSAFLSVLLYYKYHIFVLEQTVVFSTQHETSTRGSTMRPPNPDSHFCFSLTSEFIKLDFNILNIVSPEA